mgnify:CR=1 FL=1
MNNITEKYNGKNGYEGCIVHFKIIKYEIDLLQKTIFVKYDMVVENSLADNTITIQKKSYIKQDIQATYMQGSSLGLDEEGIEQFEQVQVTPARLGFTDYQTYPLQYGLDNGLTTLEAVFFENTRSHILLINNYTDEDLLIIE